MKRIALIAVILTTACTAFAQYKLDFGLQIGGSNYLGDIGGRAETRRDFIWDMHLEQTNSVLGVYGRYRLNKRLAFHGNATWIQLKDFDYRSDNPARVARNLHFRNQILEFGGRAEITLFHDNDVGGKGYYNPDFWMYAFVGIAGFSHNPQAKLYNHERDVLEGEWNDLRPLRTEGQEEEYGKWGFSIPVGIGLYFTHKKVWRFGWELNWRTTFTDYLDDISTVYGNPSGMTELGAQLSSQADQTIIDAIDNVEESGPIQSHQYTVGSDGSLALRGNPDDNDSYLTTTVSIGYVIRGKSSFYRKRYSWLKNRLGARRSRAKF